MQSYQIYKMSQMALQVDDTLKWIEWIKMFTTFFTRIFILRRIKKILLNYISRNNDWI